MTDIRKDYPDLDPEGYQWTKVEHTNRLGPKPVVDMLYRSRTCPHCRSFPHLGTCPLSARQRPWKPPERVPAVCHSCLWAALTLTFLAGLLVGGLFPW
jgi:Fe-S-cluster-containing dehydrogenase component